MASTDARPVPKKNTAYRHYFAIRKNDGTLITTWAGQDSELSQDGGAFADATNEATEIGTSGIGYIDLTAGEMNNDAVVLKVTVTNTDALPYVVTLFPEETGDIRTALTQWKDSVPADLTDTDKVQVSAQHMADGLITAAKIADNAIAATKIADAALTAAKFAAAALNGKGDWNTTTPPTAIAIRTEIDSNSTQLAAIVEDTGTTLDALLDTLVARLTAARAGYLDNLNTGGTVASQADVQGITQAQRVRVLPPPQMERPDSDSTSFRIWVYAYNEQHEAEDLDGNPTVTVENNAGTDRSGNLGSVTKPGGTTGQYYVDYTVASDHAIEALVVKVTATEGGTAVGYAQPTHVVDTTAVDFTSADRTKLEALHGKLPSADYLLGGASADGSGYSTFDSTSDQVIVATNNDKTGYSLSAAGVQAIWDALTSALTTVGSVGKRIVDYLDAAITSRSSHDAAAVKTAMEADGSKLDHLWETTEDDAGVRRFTENALEQAPSGSGATADEVKTAMEADGSKLDHLWEMTEDDDGTRRLTQNALEQAPSGETAVTVTPLSSQTSASGGVHKLFITGYQHANLGSWIITITDADGDPVDLSGCDIAMCFWLATDTAPSAPVFVLKNYDGETDITIGGASNNQLTITGDDAYSETAGKFDWVLRDQTNDAVLAEGQLKIRAAADVA